MPTELQPTTNDRRRIGTMANEMKTPAPESIKKRPHWRMTFLPFILFWSWLISLFTPSPESEQRTKKKAGAGPSPVARLCARLTAVFLFLLAIVDLSISLPHLVAGVMEIADCSLATGIFCALSFDISQLGAKLAIVSGRFVGLDRKSMASAWSIVFVFTGVSISLNVKAFVAHADTPLDVAMAWLWGIILPLSVVLFFALATQLLLASSASTPARK